MQPSPVYEKMTGTVSDEIMDCKRLNASQKRKARRNEKKRRDNNDRKDESQEICAKERRIWRGKDRLIGDVSGCL